MENYIAKKNELATIYSDNLDCNKFILPKEEANKRDSFHIYAVRTRFRNELKARLESNGIKSEIHYPIPLSQQPALKDHVEGNYKIADEISETILSLPCSIIHSSEDIKMVCEVANAAV